MRTLVLSFFLVTAVPAFADCPESCIRVPARGTTCSTAPTAVENANGYPLQFYCTETFEAGYDIPLGTLKIHSGSPFGGCDPQVVVEDDFTVLGLPTGTPVTFAAQLAIRVDGYCGLTGSGKAGASLRAASDPPQTWSWDFNYETCPTPESQHQTATLSVPVQAIAGTPVRLRFAIDGVMDELFSETIVGAFSFSGLPNGASIVSCNGYVLGPVPARPVTWGLVKASYR